MKRAFTGLVLFLTASLMSGIATSVLFLLPVALGMPIEIGTWGGAVLVLAQAAMAAYLVRVVCFYHFDDRLRVQIARVVAVVCGMIVVLSAITRLGPDDELSWRLAAYLAYCLPWAMAARSPRQKGFSSV